MCSIIQTLTAEVEIKYKNMGEILILSRDFRNQQRTLQIISVKCFPELLTFYFPILIPLSNRHSLGFGISKELLANKRELQEMIL